MRRDAALRRLTRLAEVMVQGSLSRTTRTCGREGCRCQRGERHGPHTYLTFRTADGRSSSRYVPKAELERVTRGVAAWQEFWQVAGALAAENRETIGKPPSTRRRSVRDAR